MLNWIFKMVGLVFVITAIWAFCTINHNQHISVNRANEVADLTSDSSLKPTQEFKDEKDITQKDTSVANPEDSKRLTDGNTTRDGNRDTTKGEKRSSSVAGGSTNQLNFSSGEPKKGYHPMKTSGLPHGDMQKELRPWRKERSPETKTVFTPHHVNAEGVAKDDKDIAGEQFLPEFQTRQSSEYRLTNIELQAAQKRLTQTILRLEEVTSEFWR